MAYKITKTYLKGLKKEFLRKIGQRFHQPSRKTALKNYRAAVKRIKKDPSLAFTVKGKLPSFGR